MKRFEFYFLILIAVLIFSFKQEIFAQAPTPITGDYGSVASGLWSSASTWKQWDGSGFNTVASGAPSSSAQVFIQTGNTVTYDLASSSSNCKSLIVQSGAKFQSDQVLPAGTLSVLKVAGPTIWVDGTLGKDTTDAFTIETKFNGIITLAGSGVVNIAELRPNSSQSGTLTFVFALNANINYAGTTGTGGAGIYLTRGTQTSSTITINPGVTVNFAPNSNFMNSSTVGALGNMNITLNVNGTMNVQSAVLSDTAGSTVTVNVGSLGIINVAKVLIPRISGVNNDGAYASINVASGGAINILNGGTADFTYPASKITGAGTFALKPGANINVGSAAGLDAIAGPIQTSTVAFDTAANFSYVGAGLQVFGSQLPAIVNNLTIGSTSLDSVTAALKTDGLLTVNGTLINNGGLNSAGTAIVNGTYQHNVNGNSIPTATWGTGSNCVITGTTTGDASNATTGANQNFYNFTVNCPNLAATSTACHFDMANNTIAGNLSFKNTKSNYYALTGWEVLGSPKTITVNGNLIVDSLFTSVAIDSYSSSHAIETVKLIVKGNVSVTGNFGLCIGSAKNLDNMIVMGNIYLPAGVQFYSHSSTKDSVFFAGNGVQTYTSGSLNNGNNINWVVQSGSVVDIDTSTFQGSASSFTLNSGGSVKTSSPLGLNGNIKVGGIINLSAGANYEFYAPTAQTTGALIPSTVNNLTFSNTQTDTLAKSVTVTGTATIGSGATVVETPGKYILGTATTTQPVGINAVSNIGGLGIGLSAGTDNLSSVTITRVAGPTGAIVVGASSSINRNWTLSSVNPPSAGRDLTLTWDALDNNGKDLSTSQVYNSTNGGTLWNPSGIPQNTSATQSVTFNTSSFSKWTVSDAANPLPVELTSFTAKISGNSVNLVWHTATELNNNGFDVERNFNSSSWEKISFIKGAGNSSFIKNYSFADSKLSKTGNYSYRLKQIDNTGSFKYSNIVEVNYIAPAVFSLSQNYPNPFNPNTIIEYSLPKSSFVNLVVYNAIGQSVKILENGFKDAGYYNLSFNASDLPSGIYIYRIDAGQFSQIRKMMLVK